MEWTLEATDQLPREDKVKCQCPDCHSYIYATVHIVSWSDGRIEFWGDTCLKKLAGNIPPARMPSDGSGGFWSSLGPDDRERYRNNAAALLAKWRATLSERRERKELAARSSWTPLPPPEPPPRAEGECCWGGERSFRCMTCRRPGS